MVHSAGRRRRGSVGSAVAVVLAISGLAGAGTATAASETSHRGWASVSTSIGSCGMSGWGRRGEPLVVILRSANGVVKGSKAATWYRSDDWGVCFRGRHVLTGDAIMIRQGTNDRTLIVPSLALTIDRVSDVVTVHGPSDAAIVLDLWDMYGWDDGLIEEHEVRTDGDGRYVADRSTDWSTDLAGEDGAGVSWTDPDTGDSVTSSLSAPHITVFRDGSRTEMVGAPGAVLSVEVHRPEGGLRGRAQGVADMAGRFSGPLRDASGGRATIRVGDHVTSNVAADAGFVMPDVGVRGDARSQTVSGRCPANAPFSVRDASGRWLSGPVDAWTHSDGRFSFDPRRELGGDYRLRSGDTLRLVCTLRTGDFAGDRTVVP